MLGEKAHKQKVWWITGQLQLCTHRVGPHVHEATASTVSCLMMSKNTHMFVQNHNAPVKHWDTGNMVSKQTCQNTVISGFWNTLRWDVLYNYNRHTAAINSMKECMESTWNSLSIFETANTLVNMWIKWVAQKTILLRLTSSPGLFLELLREQCMLQKCGTRFKYLSRIYILFKCLKMCPMHWKCWSNKLMHLYV